LTIAFAIPGDSVADEGPGGDLDTVVDGVAQLRVVEVPINARGLTNGGTKEV
jgi:hypothetical protein